MSETPEAQLIRARELYHSDWDAAIALYRRLVTTLPIGEFWAAAAIDLAMHEFGTGDFESSAGLAKAVLDAGRQIEPATRASAGIVLCQALEMMERDIDERALTHWVDDAVAARHPRHAASGTSMLARAALKRKEHERARPLMERTIELWNEGGSMTGGPEMLRQLALLDVEEGDIEQARRHLESALDRLRMFPEGGMAPRMLEKKITKQLHDLATKSPSTS